MHFKYKQITVYNIATSFFPLLNNMFGDFFPSQMCVFDIEDRQTEECFHHIFYGSHVLCSISGK